MKTLRVLVAAPQALDRATPWALFDASGRVVDRGAGARSSWPAADRAEAVLAAQAVRMTSIDLPPVAPSRTGAAARFALEDQLAGPADAQHLAVSAQRAGGRVIVVIAARRDVAALAASRAPRFARVIAEPDLAGPAAAWRWCQPDDGAGGFVRLPDGGAFPVGASAPASMPPELAHALDRASRDGAAPPEVVVHRAVDDADLAQWSRESGVTFRRGGPWRWDQAPTQRFTEAIDLLQGEFAAAPREAPARVLSRIFAPAFALLVVAAIVHLLAAIGDWTAVNLEAWRQARAWVDLARTAGVPDSDANDTASAKLAIAKRHAEMRRAHGLAAPSDALPLLARAAPAFATLPPGMMKSATYADDHWTFDLAPLDAPTFARLDAALRGAGTPALAATSEAGTRVRIGAP
jgi:hypothetical protein